MIVARSSVRYTRPYDHDPHGWSERAAVGWNFRSKLIPSTIVELRTLCIERYKGYAHEAELHLAPLTILVGPNNSGKTALAEAIQLFAGGLSPAEDDTSEPLPFESGGVKHAQTFADLVTGRPTHGHLRMGITLADDTSELSLSATVQNVEAPLRPSERQISDWHLTIGNSQIRLTSTGFHDLSEYAVSIPGTVRHLQHIGWRGIIPVQSKHLPHWAVTRLHMLQRWAAGVRHLRCPRALSPSPFFAPENMPRVLGPSGEHAPTIARWQPRIEGICPKMVSRHLRNHHRHRSPGALL